MPNFLIPVDSSVTWIQLQRQISSLIDDNNQIPTVLGPMPFIKDLKTMTPISELPSQDSTTGFIHVVIPLVKARFIVTSRMDPTQKRTASFSVSALSRFGDLLTLLFHQFSIVGLPSAKGNLYIINKRTHGTWNSIQNHTVGDEIMIHSEKQVASRTIYVG